MTTAPRPSLHATQRAARAAMDDLVREGAITRRYAVETLTMGLPMVVRELANLRRSGMAPESITRAFTAKLDAAKRLSETATTPAEKSSARVRIAGARLYLAAWSGMQDDLAAYTTR
ncbi:hypothetical protein ACIOEX_11175 [Streptomyces sp. NPDC087850]|uniref:hypothetical protein n=1 Tax=Streptomyces sp. NPDC087850 TaxID=3365809 RepID=UPI00380A9704